MQIPPELYSPLAILASASVAWFLATKTTKSQRAIARKRATLDFVSDLEKNSVRQEATEAFTKHRNAKSFDKLLDPKDDELIKDRQNVLSFLNSYELMFCGVMEDSLDELFLYQWHRGSVIHHWHDVRGIVKQWRDFHGNERLFSRFELFASNWERGAFVCRANQPPSHYQCNSVTPAHFQDETSKFMYRIKLLFKGNN